PDPRRHANPPRRRLPPDAQGPLLLLPLHLFPRAPRRPERRINGIAILVSGSLSCPRPGAQRHCPGRHFPGPAAAVSPEEHRRRLLSRTTPCGDPFVLLLFPTARDEP